MTPLTPTFNNNNIQLFQTPDYVVMYHEMIHDVRVIPLDGRPHIAERISQWRGDARGRWDGDTLVVETINFHDQMAFLGSGPGMRLTRGEAHGESEFSIPTNGGESADNLRRFNSLGLTPFRHPLGCKTVR